VREISMEHIIDVRNVSYRYPNSSDYSLKDISLSVGKGEVVGLAGSTGAGKTTLLLSILGIVPGFYGGDFYGNIVTCGLDTVSSKVSEIGLKVGFVFQDPDAQLIAPTVEEEIAFSLENASVPRDEIRSRIKEVLKIVRLEGFEYKRPHELSGGQKQRLAIAAALALRPEVILLDEPTSQLDPSGAEQVFSIIADLRNRLGLTAVIASHDIEWMAEFCDRIIVLDKGSAISDDTPGHVFGKPEILNGLGLRVPQVTELYHGLLQAGLYSGDLPVTFRDAVSRFDASWLNGSAVDGNGESEPSESSQSVVETVDLTHVYPDGTKALEGINVRVPAGVSTALIGQNGAGKSTMVKHFVKLLLPTSGDVKIGSVSTKKLRSRDLAGRIGMVFQNPDAQIFNSTVQDEVSFALRFTGFPKDEIEHRVGEALSEMGLEEFRGLHPLSLSKGDRERVAIAATLAMRPSTVILDEPTTGQDHSGSMRILAIAKSLLDVGNTVIVITHHLHLLPEFASQAIVMGKGKVLKKGPLRDIFYDTATLHETYLSPPQLVRFWISVNKDRQRYPKVLTVPEALRAMGIGGRGGMRE
jgi:energy-coupling factor transporter ATP-binding protein EcfA2